MALAVDGGEIQGRSQPLGLDVGPSGEAEEEAQVCLKVRGFVGAWEDVD